MSVMSFMTYMAQNLYNFQCSVHIICVKILKVDSLKFYERGHKVNESNWKWNMNSLMI